MKCPKCGNELTEGHLYCDTCGEEIRIVPDFEPEIENSINETLSTLADDVRGESESADEPEEAGREEEQKPRPAPAPRRNRRYRRIALTGGVFLAAVIVCAASIIFYRGHSFSYQVECAVRCADQGNYTEAINYLAKAREMNPEEAQLCFLTADYYYAQGKTEFALSTLEEVRESELYSKEDVLRAYDKIIGIYKVQGDYQAINDLLINCRDTDIVNTYQSYIAKVPEYSYDEGIYNEVIPLKLSANTSGKIYYTLDGSVPDENSEVYAAPIFLETGEYTVSALFVNDYGIKSAVAAKTYRINLAAPVAPEVLTYSDRYTEPAMIEVQTDPRCRVYYTTDGTPPTRDSYEYTAPIPMPPGTTTYQFISISPEDVPSEVISRTYVLELETGVTPEMAVGSVIQALIKQDVLLSAEGNARGVSGRYAFKFNSVERVADLGNYYIIYEYYEDSAGLQSKTGRLYAVDLEEGAANRLVYDENGNPGLIPL